jgi:acyl-lipid Delta6-acetylenase / acyl-lipid (9-3)-desaturase
MPFLAWSEDALELFTEYSDDTMARLWISHQPVLLFPLFIFARLSWSFESIRHPLHGNIKASTSVLDTLGILIHFIWQFVLPLLWLSPSRALCYFALSQSMGGFLLALVFVLNHSGRPVLNKDVLQTKGFYELQVLTARDIDPSPFLDWISGGLNYQIEHHLFPTLPRHNYHLVAPHVQEVCVKHQVHYHRTTFRQGMVEVLDRLRRVSRLAAKGGTK